MHNCTMHLLGGNDVLANLNTSNRNADQPIFDDITDMLRDEWLQIWDGFTDEERAAVIAQAPESDSRPISRNGWITEQIPAFRDMLEVLSCRVVCKDDMHSADLYSYCTVWLLSTH